MTKSSLRQQPGNKRLRHSHIWERDGDDFYVEPRWVDDQLFKIEGFDRHRPLLDPCCGLGRISEAAKVAGYHVEAADLVDRGYPGTKIEDFLDRRAPAVSIIANPPFDQVEDFARHSLLNLRAAKVALILPTARLNAAHRWLRELPLSRIWLLTPRPSMPPGHIILAGEKPKGGKKDFCWLIFERGYVGAAQIGWLHRGEIPEHKRGAIA
jgi:hypothetical protein